MRALQFMGISLIGGILAAGLLAAPQARAEVYGLKSTANVDTFSVAPTNFFTFKEDGSSFTDYGAITRNGSQVDLDALAYNPNPTIGLRAFQLVPDGDHIGGSFMVSLDIDGGVGNVTASVIGNGYQSREIRGATFIGDQLWVLDAKATRNQILQINPNTGGEIPGSAQTLSQTIGNACDLAVHADGTVYLVSYNKVYTVNLTNGTMTLQNTEDPASVYYAGLAFSGNASADRLFTFDVQATDDIYALDKNNGYNRTLLYYDIIPPPLPGFNSGGGDLASNVPIPGAAWLLGTGLLGLAGLRRKFSR